MSNTNKRHSNLKYRHQTLSPSIIVIPGNVFHFYSDPATIIKRQNSTIQVGGYAALICQSEGNPTSVITWTRDKTNKVIGYESTLDICSAQFYDGGWYTCSSANSLGKDTASVYLKVTGNENDYLM